MTAAQPGVSVRESNLEVLCSWLVSPCYNFNSIHPGSYIPPLATAGLAAWLSRCSEQRWEVTSAALPGRLKPVHESKVSVESTFCILQVRLTWESRSRSGVVGRWVGGEGEEGKMNTMWLTHLPGCVSRLSAAVSMCKMVKAASLCVFPSPVCHLTLLHPSTPRFRTFYTADWSVNFTTLLKKQSAFLSYLPLHLKLKLYLAGTPQPVLFLTDYQLYWAVAAAKALLKKQLLLFPNRSSLKGWSVSKSMTASEGVVLCKTQYTVDIVAHEAATAAHHVSLSMLVD